MSEFREICAVLAAIGRCHANLRAHAASLKTRAGVLSSSHAVNISELPMAGGVGFRIDESVGVELPNGDAIDWLVEITGNPDPPKLRIEAGIWRVESMGSYLTVEIMDLEFDHADKFAGALDAAVLQLCKVIPIP